jgi:hypothetical protein
MSGVSIDEDGYVHRVRQPGNMIHHFGQGQEGYIGFAHQSSGGGIAANEQCLEAGLFDNPGVQGIMGSGHDQNLRIEDVFS